jgi:DNA-binding SARP family transcriptional activator/tetratricopeptide (TPR) repeat protein
MFALRVLGGVSLEGENGPLRGKSVQPRRIALLALLAADPHHTLSRDKLIALLWPESDAEQGRHRLSESLYVLRKALGEEALISEGDGVRLDPAHLSCDAILFSTAVADGELERAVSIYSGPFLDGFFLKDSHEFDLWAESVRSSLAEAFGRALETLATAANRDGDPLKALEWWSRLSAHDPYNSRFALGRMEAMARAGDPGNAIHFSREHARFLAEELGVEPTQELLAFAESLTRGEGPVQLSGGEPERVAGPERDSASESEPEGGLGAEPGLADTSPILPGRKARLWLGAVGVIVTFLGAGAVYSSLTGPPQPDLIQDLVVVPPFENRTGDPELDELAVLAAAWVEETIQQVDGVQIVPSSFARQYAAEASMGGSPGPAQAVAERSGAGWAVGGAIGGLGDSLELRAEIIDVSRPRKKQRVVEVGSREKPNEVLDRLARRVAGALAYEFDPWMGEMETGSQPLPSPPAIEAFREHRLGYEAYNRQDRVGSFQHHMAAFELDTTLVRALVAAAFMAVDYQVKDSLARYANERRHLLSTMGRLDLDILLAYLANDLAGGLRGIRELARLEGAGFNSVIEARFAMRVNLPGAALAATDRYDPYLEWRRDEAHFYWRYRTDALHMLGEFEAELDEARLGRDRFPNRLDLLLSEVRALAALGRIEEIWDRLHQARALPDTHASVAVVAGTELRAHGHLDSSRDVFNRAAEWLKDGLAGDGLDSTEQHYLAEALYGAERWAEAREVSMSLLADSPEDLSALGMVGLTGARLGDSALASGVIDRLSGMSRRDAPGEHRYLMASISAVLDEPDEAMRMLYGAFREGFPHGLRLHRDMNFESLREREDFRALVTPKG